jgi:acyl carrier protein
MSVTTELEAFIVDEIALGRGMRSIAPDEDLLARGVIDSLGVTQLVAFLEERYSIRVTDEELTPANFRSLARLEAFVESKRPAARSW